MKKTNAPALLLMGLAMAAASAASDEPVATVGGSPVSAAQVEEEAHAALADLRAKEYAVRSRALDEIIARIVLDKEAVARGVSVAELTKAEIEAKSALGEGEARAFYEANKERFKGRPEEEILKQIEAGLRQQRAFERRLAFVRELRAKFGVKVLLEPPRVAVAAGDGPARGPKDAPVTIVEFSDFQCPYCARVAPTLEQVRQAYGDRVRIVFRDFPLPSHAQAPKAAEAAACARDQGKFWEMHDRLFANQAKLEVPDLKRAAADLGLDAEKFDQCLDSGRRAADWQGGVAEGSRLGVTATPSLFVNGRMLVGAQPFEGLAQVIDDELQRVAPPAAAPGH